MKRTYCPPSKTMTYTYFCCQEFIYLKTYTIIVLYCNFSIDFQQACFIIKLHKDTSSSSSSSGSYTGHASLMNGSSWQTSWKKDGLLKATITSSPKEKSAQWIGKIDGVQYEPIGYWAGTSDGSAVVFVSPSDLTKSSSAYCLVSYTN